MEKKMTELTNEELVMALTATLPTNGEGIFGDLKDELLRRLGVAVSASPQPRSRVPECAYCHETEMLTVIGPKRYACPKHITVARPSEPSAPKIEPPKYWQCPNNEAHHLRFGEKIYGTEFHRQYCIHCPDTEAVFRSRPTQATETASAPQLGQLLGEVLIKAGVLHGEFPLTEDQITFAAKEYLAAPSVAGTQPTPEIDKSGWKNVPIPPPKDYYKCFGCKAVFVDDESAEKHFGKPKEREWPLCAAQGPPQVEEGELLRFMRLIAELPIVERGMDIPNAAAVLQQMAKNALRSHLPGAPAQPGPEPCKFDIGQRVYWQGQFGECSGVIIEITRPENSGYVLKLDIGDGAETYSSESEVSPSPAQGTPEPPRDIESLFSVWAGNGGNFTRFGPPSYREKEIAIEFARSLAGPQNGHGWVFTSSGELPESRMWVNVCTEHAGQRNVVPAFGVRQGNGWRWECEFEVIAWQPLPEAPK